MGWIYLVSVVLLAIAVVGVLVDRARAKETAEQAYQNAHDDYQAALAALTVNPTNADVKQQALALGRAYAALGREQGVTIFDEMALMNDINAATAGAMAAPVMEPAASIETRLQELERLRAKGVLTDAEYAQKRQRLIDDM